MAKLLYGEPVAKNIEENVKLHTSVVNRVYKLCVVSVGKDPASEIYVRNKGKAAERCGIVFEHVILDESISEKELIDKIVSIKNDVIFPDTKIIVQLPLPKHINTDNILNLIDPDIDVDGFHPENIGKLMLNLPCYESCTPASVMQILKYYDIPVEGKNCVVIGRSNMVGKPMAAMLTNANGTVTLCHSKTKDLKMYTQNADILVVAMGQPEFIDHTYVKRDAVVIDVGIHRKDGKIVGDTRQDGIMMDKVKAITPVPGGVGKTTVAMLMHNVVSK